VVSAAEQDGANERLSDDDLCRSTNTASDESGERRGRSLLGKVSRVNDGFGHVDRQWADAKGAEGKCLSSDVVRFASLFVVCTFVAGNDVTRSGDAVAARPSLRSVGIQDMYCIVYVA
jgi:hypothetical protein